MEKHSSAVTLERTQIGGSPSWSATILFFLLFSGPPMFRMRDPNASLEGVIDPIVVMQVSVWIIAGLWTLLEVHRCSKVQALTVSVGGKLGLGMALLLCLSVPTSEAPALSAYKIGQMLVSIVFTWLFVERYGIATSLRYIFLGSVGLCAGIAISAFVAPDLVLFQESHGLRLRGEFIADTGVVTSYAIMLLLIRSRRIAGIIFWPLLAMLVTLSALSLTREAWFVVFAFAVLFFTKRMRSAFVRNMGYVTFVVLPAFFLFYILPALQMYRSTETIWTLSDRIGLWLYLAGITLARSPWIGLGYYSASRVFGPEYNPGLGTAHSMFMEVFVGGGVLSLIPFLALCMLSLYRASLLILKGKTLVEFTCGMLFFASVAFGAMGADFGYGPMGITFWTLVAAIPLIPKQFRIETKVAVANS